MKHDNDMYNSQGYSVAKGGYPGSKEKTDWIFWLSLPVVIFSFIWHRPEAAGVIGDLSRFMHEGGKPSSDVVQWSVLVMLGVTMSHFLLWPGSWLMELPDAIKNVPDERCAVGILNGFGIVASMALLNYLGLASNDWLAFAVLLLFACVSAFILLRTIQKMGLGNFLECVYWGLLICITFNQIFGGRRRG